MELEMILTSSRRFICHTLMDLSFSIDVVLSFRMAFPLNEDQHFIPATGYDMLETNPRKIASRSPSAAPSHTI